MATGTDDAKGSPVTLAKLAAINKTPIINEVGFTLIENEGVKFFCPAVYWCPYTGAKSGSLFMTSFRIIFKSSSEYLFFDCFLQNMDAVLEIPLKNDACFNVEHFLCSIAQVNHSYVTATNLILPSNNALTAANANANNNFQDCVEIVFKDCRVLKFVFSPGEKSRVFDFIKKLKSLAFPLTKYGSDKPKTANLSSSSLSKKPSSNSLLDADLPAIKFYHENKEGLQPISRISNYYNAAAEFSRQMKNVSGKFDLWRLTDLNKDYKLCSSYSKSVVVPSLTDDFESTLRKVAPLFNNNRFPIMSWIHPKNRAVLMRSGEPSKKDITHNEAVLVMEYLKAVSRVVPMVDEMTMVDMRSRVNATTFSMTKFKGDMSKYPSVNYMFLDLISINEIQTSYLNICKLCCCESSCDDPNWHSSLEATKWLEYLHNIMSGVAKVVDILHRQNTPAILNCSDGSDRTSQVVSLTMLCCDPYYRTIDGFIVLVEKEWCAAGHQFSRRCLHGLEGKTNQEGVSPIFLQFLNCVWLLMDYLPNAFQYTEEFLLKIIEAVYSCMYGNFLEDSEEKRFANYEKTFCLWSALTSSSQVGLYTNVLYDGEYYNRVIRPPTSPPYFHLWTGFFMRNYPGNKPGKANSDFLSVLIGEKLKMVTGKGTLK